MAAGGCDTGVTPPPGPCKVAGGQQPEGPCLGPRSHCPGARSSDGGQCVVAVAAGGRSLLAVRRDVGRVLPQEQGSGMKIPENPSILAPGKSCWATAKEAQLLSAAPGMESYEGPRVSVSLRWLHLLEPGSSSARPWLSLHTVLGSWNAPGLSGLLEWSCAVQWSCCLRRGCAPVHRSISLWWVTWMSVGCHHPLPGQVCYTLIAAGF